MSALDRKADHRPRILLPHRIAAVLGGPWPDRISTAYSLKEQARAEESTGVMVLRDVMEVFNERNADRLQSAELVAVLVEMEDRRWPDWRHGKPITAASLTPSTTSPPARHQGRGAT